jgi:hypothetical protein
MPILSCSSYVGTNSGTIYTYQPETDYFDLVDGKKIAFLGDSSLELRVALDHYNGSELGLYVELTNHSDSDIWVSPSDFSIIYKSTQASQAPVNLKPINPDDEIDRIKSEISRVRGMDALNTAFSCCSSGLDFANTVSGKSTKTDSEREQERQNTENIRNDHANEIAALESELSFWETFAFSKSILHHSEQKKGVLIYKSTIYQDRFLLSFRNNKSILKLTFQKIALGSSSL